MYYDVCAFSGHWPFRRLRKGAFPERKAEYQHLGFGGGVLSSLDAIFYNDPREGDAPLLEALSGSGWRLAICVNPLLPWTEQAMEQAALVGVKHLRLYPGIHRYEAGAAESVFQKARELGMTVIVTARMEDPRLSWMLEQSVVSAEAFSALAAAYPNGKVLLSGFYLDELTALSRIPGNLWADTAGLCHGLSPVEELLASGFPGERILFGSLSPLQSLQSHILNLPAAYREQLLSHNPRRFLEVYDDGF